MVSSETDGLINNKNPANSLYIKMTALSCVLLLSFGSHYAAHTIGTLKAIIKEDLDIDNTKYGVLQSSVSLVNTILPILGGFFVDSFGTCYGSLAATLLITLGSTFVALSSNYKSFALMVAGRAIYGLGSGTIVTVQETIISHWFSGKGLGASMGLKLAVTRLGSFMAFATVIPITEYFGFYGYSLWFSAIVCIISLLLNILYVTLENKIGFDQTKTKKFNPKDVLKFPLIFWAFISLGLFLSSAWTSFIHINTEFIKLRFHESNKAAALYASISQIGPFFIPPILGRFIDRYGKRPLLTIVCASFFVVSMLTLVLTHLPPILGMSIFSISLSMGPVLITSCIPMILPKSMVGTALGLYKSSMNIGNTLQDITVGYLQDLTKGYTYPVMFLAGCGFIGIIAGCIIYTTDKRQLENRLSISDKERNERNIEETKLSQNTLKLNYIPITTIAVLLVASWISYATFFF